MGQDRYGQSTNQDEATTRCANPALNSTSGAIEFLDHSKEVRMPSVVFCEFGMKGFAENNVAHSDGADDFSSAAPGNSILGFN